MLEILAAEDYGQWSDDRIWAELEQRLAAADRPAIQRGEFVERDIQEFSNVMLSLFSAGAAGDGGSGFSQGLRRARLDLILGDPRFSRWFAHAYAGVTG